MNLFCEILYQNNMQVQRIYHVLSKFERIHPLRFWFLTVVSLLIIGVLIIAIRRFAIRMKRTKVTMALFKGPNSNTVGSMKVPAINENGDQIMKWSHPKRRILIKRIIMGAGIILLALGTVFGYNTLRVNSRSTVENISISKSTYLFGIDVSHYQGKIDWHRVRLSHHPIKFIFIRATMGVNGRDNRYRHNWNNAGKHKYIRGAYHYFRPNEDAYRQFKNYSAAVKLKKGDLIPVLDVEETSKFGVQHLRKGVRTWLMLAEKEFGVKPLIYSGRTFYKKNLKGHVNGYPLWIAAYSGKNRLRGVDWTFHQFTEKVRVKGIRSAVDGNDFNGTLADLEKFRMK